MNAMIEMHGQNGAWVFAENTYHAGLVAEDQLPGEESSDCFWLDIETAQDWALWSQVQHYPTPHALFYWRAGRNVMEFCGIQLEDDDA
jgi:hypothetical protein